MPTFRKRFKKVSKNTSFITYVIASCITFVPFIFGLLEGMFEYKLYSKSLHSAEKYMLHYISFYYGLCKDQEFLEDCTSTILFKVHLAKNSTMQGLVNRYLMYHFAICT